MIQILHNSRCRKSREGLALLEQTGKPYEVINYLEEPLSKDEITTLLKKLSISPLELVRTNEAIWKEQYKGKTLTDNEIITALQKFPKLIERPVVINGNKAVIGRPAEKIINLLK